MPFALYALVTIFLFTTIFWMGDAPIWKSSPLILLQIRDKNNPFNSLKDAREAAEKEKVKLVRSEDGWWLRRTAKRVRVQNETQRSI